MPHSFSLSGQLVDIHNRDIFPAAITVTNGKISSIQRLGIAEQRYILPGFIDAHIHIESSMLVPSEFARIAVTHGTVATVSDPHEIANVCGIAGVQYMLDNAATSPLKFNFGAPSCVPATNFETAGAIIDADGIAKLLAKKEIRYLAEMMNFPGVLFEDKEVMAKIAAAKKAGKPIDGHAPGLRGDDAKKYIAAGISTDHECTNIEEAKDKLSHGMKILIREGSAAKNFDALVDLIHSHPGQIMFCSDDKHPDELIKGHINELVVRAIKHGCSMFDVLHAACVLPVQHYNLDVGLLRVGDDADFIIVDGLDDFKVLDNYIAGNLVAKDGKSLIAPSGIQAINNFGIDEQTADNFKVRVADETEEINCKIIEALDGQLITSSATALLRVEDNCIQTNVAYDILKIGVVNRYNTAPIAMGFIKNFGLTKGALASSVAHDSHNIVFVGVDDESICEAVNAIIRVKGGISLYDGVEAKVMPLPIAGLMSDKDAQQAGEEYQAIDRKAKQLGSKLGAPFMTLSFMALPVIPQLKMTDIGLFDVQKFEFVDLQL